jgi:hypothetical protein
MRSLVGRFIALGLLAPTVAIAQGAAPGATGGAPPPGPSNAPAQPAPPSGKQGDGKDAKPPPAPDRQGYSYRDGPRKPVARRAPRRVGGPVATLPGFEMRPDGGSRVFVQLSQEVQVEERKAAGSITYILKGAHVAVWNNTNALVTVHFDTPVSRARLVPHGRDTWLIIDLRAAAAPALKVTPSADKTALLSVDFPRLSVAPTEKAEPKEAPPPAPAAKDSDED